MNGSDVVETDIDSVLGTALATGPSAANDPIAAVRARGIENARRFGLPVRKQEAWRYTPVSFLQRAAYQPYTDGPNQALQAGDIDELLLAGSAGPRMVFVNGHYAPALSALGDIASGIHVSSLAKGLAGDGADALPEQFDQVADHRHLFSAMNSALMADGALIRVDPGTRSELPIEVLHIAVGSDEPVMFHPRHLVLVGAGSDVRLVERYASLGLDSVYFNNAVLEVVVEEGASLIHECLQQESPRAQHLTDLNVRLGATARYRYALAALGGEWSRCELKLRFDGEGASADLNGLMLARDGQLNDVHLDIDHAVPSCTSTETFKSILEGRGRVVFDGRILVARDAQKTDAALTNHNLMLSRSAEVDSKPQLEIFADDVKCSHGTTVGELDREKLFYLRSRGVPEKLATRMLCQGFANDVLERFVTPALRERAARVLDERLLTAAG
ncbi:MAG: Fe-S cluster assembly protein SufD [Gammaproteobacteria bacterium]|nr:Fe-S cluster assembly protein SufD [Gammaproteobacteria bacterium]